MNEDNTTEFAFGKNTVDGCPCPALAAGYNPSYNSKAVIVAEQYDSIFQEEIVGTGTVTEEQAREAWKEVIDHFVKRRDQADDESDAQYYAERVELARDVKDELGW